MWVESLGWEDPLEQSMTTHSSILAWRIPMDGGSSWATVHMVAKSQTWLKWLGTHTGDFYIKIKILSNFSSVLFLWEPSVLCLLFVFPLSDDFICLMSGSKAQLFRCPKWHHHFCWQEAQRSLYMCALGHTHGIEETLSALPSPKLPDWKKLADCSGRLPSFRRRGDHSLVGLCQSS